MGCSFLGMFNDGFYLAPSFILILQLFPSLWNKDIIPWTVIYFFNLFLCIMFQMRCMFFLRQTNGYLFSYWVKIKLKTGWVGLRSWQVHHLLILGLAQLDPKGISIPLYQVIMGFSTCLVFPNCTWLFLHILKFWCVILLLVLYFHFLLTEVFDFNYEVDYEISYLLLYPSSVVWLPIY